MVDNQHKQIKGYRDLSEAEIAVMNEIKQKANECEELIKKIKCNSEVDLRWVAIGTTDLQTGFMALTRSIARPTSF